MGHGWSIKKVMLILIRQQRIYLWIYKQLWKKILLSSFSIPSVRKWLKSRNCIFHWNLKVSNGVQEMLVSKKWIWNQRLSSRPASSPRAKTESCHRTRCCFHLSFRKQIHINTTDYCSWCIVRGKTSDVRAMSMNEINPRRLHASFSFARFLDDSQLPLRKHSMIYQSEDTKKKSLVDRSKHGMIWSSLEGLKIDFNIRFRPNQEIDSLTTPDWVRCVSFVTPRIAIQAIRSLKSI